jgi:hypothetical protein
LLIMNRFHFCAWMFGAGVLAVAACRSDDDDPPGNTPRAGATGVSGTGGGSTAGSDTGGTGTGGSGTGGTGGSGTGGGEAGSSGQAGSPGIPATLKQINDPTDPMAVAKDTLVRVTGLVAVSQKFRVSRSTNNGKCLWGVFATTPGDTVQEYSSIEIVASGANAVLTTLPNGKEEQRCPTDDDKGGLIPNSIKPGDIIDVSAFVDEFKINLCGQPNQQGGTNPDPVLAQRQLENVVAITVTPGTAVPAPKVFTQGELNQLTDGLNTDEINRKWAGALVRLDGPFTAFQPNASDYFNLTNAVSRFGRIAIEGTNFAVSSLIFFRDLTGAGPEDKGPVYSFDISTQFQSFTGIHLLDFCTWTVSTRSQADVVTVPATTQ